MPMDNLSSGSKRDVYFARLPDIWGLISGMEGQYLEIPFSILQVTRANGTDGVLKLGVSKVMEDKDGKTLPATSGVSHDVKRNSFWMGSVVAPFIIVFEDAMPHIVEEAHVVDETHIASQASVYEELLETYGLTKL
jgi:hypothetical protein